MITKRFDEMPKSFDVHLQLTTFLFFNKTIIYFYGKSIQMEIINNIILETRAYS